MSGAVSSRSLATKNEILIRVNYSESCENKQQQEPQSIYFGYTRFSIIIACSYLHDTENKIICESVTISSNLSDISRAAAIASLLMVIDHLREKHQHVPLKNNPTVWSDGCSAQFWSLFVFKLLLSIDSSLNITLCYNKSHQVNGSMDGIGETLKNCVYCRLRHMTRTYSHN